MCAEIGLVFGELLGLVNENIHRFLAILFSKSPSCSAYRNTISDLFGTVITAVRVSYHSRM